MRALSHRIVFFLRLASAHPDVDGASERDTDSPIPRPNPRVRSGIPLTWALTVSHDCATHAPSKRKTRAAARHVRVKSLKTYMCMTSTPKSYGIRREAREAVINLPEVSRRRFTSLLADVRDGDAGVASVESWKLAILLGGRASRTLRSWRRRWSPVRTRRLRVCRRR